jgi:hypothetical protein
MRKAVGATPGRDDMFPERGKTQAVDVAKPPRNCYMASGDVNVQNSRSISGRPRRAIVAAAPALLGSLALHGAGTTSQIDGTTRTRGTIVAAPRNLGSEDGWRVSHRCRTIQGRGVLSDTMTTTGEPFLEQTNPSSLTRSVRTPGTTRPY